MGYDILRLQLSLFLAGRSNVQQSNIACFLRYLYGNGRFVFPIISVSEKITELASRLSFSLEDETNAHSYMYRTGKPLYNQQLKPSKNRQEQTIIDILYMKSSLIIPLLLHGKIIGFLDLSISGKEISEKLLLNILPEEVALELKQKEAAEPVLFENVSVMFTDFKGFTKNS